MANRMTDLKDLQPTETYILGHCAEDGSVLDPSKANPSAWGHVMITQPSFGQTADGLTIGVVEAAAGKRSCDILTMRFATARNSPRARLFTVWRGSKSDPMNVRVSRPKV